MQLLSNQRVVYVQAAQDVMQADPGAVRRTK